VTGWAVQRGRTVQKLGVTDIVVGELSDAAAVAKALEGIDAAFYIAPAALENEAEVGKQFASAAKQAGYGASSFRP
jgi:uncharacterized protein YbjT (DUF2867 family)